MLRKNQFYNFRFPVCALPVYDLRIYILQICILPIHSFHIVPVKGHVNPLPQFSQYFFHTRFFTVHQKYIQFPKFSAAGKRAAADPVKPVRKRKFLKLPASVKNIVPDLLHRFRKHHLGDLLSCQKLFPVFFQKSVFRPVFQHILIFR